MTHSSLKTPWQKRVDFSPEIESLRGIASLAVVLGHLYLFLFASYYNPLNSSAFDLKHLIVSGLFDPQPAVLLFFTISGLVLGRQLRKEPIKNSLDFVAYLCRRIFRLVPLMWITTVFAFFLCGQWSSINFNVLVSNLLLKDISLNLPLWSLKVELWCSLVFPLIFLMFEFGDKGTKFLMFALFAYLSFSWEEPIYIQFLVFFQAGLIVDSLSKLQCIKAIPFQLATIILALALIAFFFAPQFGFGIRNWGYGHWQSWVLVEIVACPLILLVIVSNICPAVNAILRFPPIRYLGKISFSVYLIHLPLFLYLRYLHPSVGIYQHTVFILGYLALVFSLSALSFRFIEIPSNNLGKRLSTALLKFYRERAGTESISAS